MVQNPKFSPKSIGKQSEGGAAAAAAPMYMNNKMKTGNNSMKLNVNNYNNKPINKFNKIAATSAVTNATTTTVTQTKNEPAATPGIIIITNSIT